MTAFRDQVTHTGHDRSKVLQNLLEHAVPELLKFVRDAEQEKLQHQNGHRGPGGGAQGTSLVDSTSTSIVDLQNALVKSLEIKESGSGAEGLQTSLEAILKYSVNPSSPGFLDKLYSAPLPPGILAEWLLSVLNANLHVYHVSPALTLVEKHVTKLLASQFGLDGQRSGGISVQGGSASNLTSIAIARNSIFPETKVYGNGVVNGRLLIFTSSHSHYSVEKAAQALGMGRNNVISVPVDEQGRMSVPELERLIIESKELGDLPFYINATAGTTVLGAFDPFEDIAQVARKHRMWLHVDAAWGGGFVFSQRREIRERLRGISLANSIATNPHKMLGVPVTCSFLLGKDLKQFHDANTLKAGYLFHDEQDGDVAPGTALANGASLDTHADDWKEPYDLADLTLQCGRRGDSLKFFFSWRYYGTLGYSKMVDDAYDVACHLSKLVEARSDLTPVLVSGQTPSCLQVCFYYTPHGRFVYGLLEEAGYLGLSLARPLQPDEKLDKPSRREQLGKLNSNVTANITKALIPRGFMVDFAPALAGQEDRGAFFRVVVNISTIRETVEKLIGELVTVGESVVSKLRTEQNFSS